MKSNVSFFFREKGVSYTVNQMRGAGTEKEQTHEVGVKFSKCLTTLSSQQAEEHGCVRC